MKKVIATMLTYDADVGRIEPGQEYLIEDAKADRWIFSGIAEETKQQEQQPPPEAEPIHNEPEEAESEEDDDAAKVARARELHEEGATQNQIAEELGVSRNVVRRMLAD